MTAHQYAMKIHIITIGQPKLEYARVGWSEYYKRLNRFHTLRVTHISDKQNDSIHLLQAAGNSYKIGLVIEGRQFSSSELSIFLEHKALLGKEVCFLVGGPEGLPEAVIDACDDQWSLSKLTLPHDLAMVVTLEALYRASSIAAGLPYHK